jgi:hypothetical protein
LMNSSKRRIYEVVFGTLKQEGLLPSGLRAFFYSQLIHSNFRWSHSDSTTEGKKRPSEWTTEMPTKGQMYGRLMYLGNVMSTAARNRKWAMSCGECGSPFEAFASNVRTGRTKTCGQHRRGVARPRQERVCYRRAHQRVAEAKGKASWLPCVDGCGNYANHWSYDGMDPEQLWETINGKDTPYSLKPEHYQPRCASCHKQFDIHSGLTRRAA